MAGERVPGTEAYDGDDLLMAAITGADVSEEDSRSAEYHAAVADLGQLRLVLRDLGEELADGPAAEPEPVARPVPADPERVRVRRRRMFAVAVRAVAAAGAVGLFGGLLWMGAQNGLGGDAGDAKSRGDAAKAPGFQESESGAADQDAGGSSDEGAAQDRGATTRAQQIACSRILVEGRATELTPRPGGKVDVTLAVDRWYRPEQSAKTHPTTTVTLPALTASGIERGELVLITVYRHASDGYGAEQGWGVGDVRPELLAALEESRGLDCPTPWRERPRQKD
ncbi:hypothetical protein ACIBI4_34385 [Streptomyces sp. NPDC050418]|uniref:hypothetical protein n=1 Tax=Streptomyces sp. NPDC050418 TaxID=3365612 RepID=UPI0037B33251